jgi:DNA-binding transcriptional ArsR family regulator/rhodanese-related sulfurtransferase
MGKDREIKDQLYAQLARVAKALASPRRLELLELLAQRPHTVEELAAGIGQSVAATSHHLQGLKAARLVETAREGQHIRYRLADRNVAGLVGNLRAVAHDRLAEVERLTRQLGDGPVTELSRRELVRRAKDGDVVLLDVRPESEFDHHHLKGATNIPVGELKKRLDELDPDVEVVAYCRGPYCLMAHDAVRLLERRGFSASRLDEGALEFAR